MKEIICVMLVMLANSAYAAREDYVASPDKVFLESARANSNIAEKDIYGEVVKPEEASLNIAEATPANTTPQPVKSYGTAAGSNAPLYGVGSSAIIVPSVVVAVAGVMLLSMGGSGSNASNTSTTTTTTTTTTPSH
ncbi:hypothetical protein [Mangrovibacter phragmitis]|uniref:hypothetical protein n=1 Tax=Mangrovibacter phragmitis TaxID=1691903 RepID=UPI001E3EB886|nr:hypothetical protein [Mangrovibacter phragmitis]